MTQEDKDLLLADICARQPYKPYVEITDEDEGYVGKLLGLEMEYDNVCGTITTTTAVFEYIPENVRPYLRPMSSMTEEEKMEFTKLFNKWHDTELFDYIEEGAEFSIWKHKGISPVVFDWLNKHHFDYCGFIDKGLALEAKEGMYNK